MSTPVKVHAHRCEECAKKGESIFWIHSDNCAGIISKHKCPKCGAENWEKALIEPPKRHTQTAAQPSGMDIETMLGYAMLIIALGFFGYAAYLYWQERKGKKVLPS